MHWPNFFSRIVSLLLLPLFLFYQFELPAVPPQTRPIPYDMGYPQIPEFNNYNFTYDDVLDLLEELEDGDLENRCSPQELWRINCFVALLAKKGILPNQFNEESTLDRDIQELFYGVGSGNSFSMISAMYGGQADIVLCKSWVKKQCNHVKNFVKKHKTAIIVGAAIVVAVIIVVATAGTGAPGAAELVSAAGAAAAGGAAADSNSDEDSKSSSESIATSPNVADSQNHPNLASVLEEQISSFKELVIEENLLPASGISSSRIDPSIANKARELGSFLAHETLEGITQLTSWVPGLFEEIKDLAAKILPETPSNSDNFLWKGSPSENFESLLATGHEKIDEAFSTNQASLYPKEADNKYTIGIIPLPGSLSIAGSPAGRIPLTLAADACGWEVGESITNRTIFGTVPKWSTVRRRYWKNEAAQVRAASGDPKYLSDPVKYSEENIRRMEQGLAPQRLNLDKTVYESVELHHIPPQREGGLFDFVEMWPDEHAGADEFRRIGR